jgi:enoyl-CoA hydratase/carnithine racemase
MFRGLFERETKLWKSHVVPCRLAWEIAKNGPIAIRAAKEAIDVGIKSPDIQNALQIERQCYQRVIPTQDRLEGLTAFREGRSPVYKGN